jgi:predicted transcriptional regulator of viral defense system
MYYDTLYLMNTLSDYSSPKSKLTNMVKSGEIVRIRRGLYVKEGDYDKKSLANMIYGPSYISFEYALSWYGLIPERVVIVTSAVFNKNKNKEFDTPVGRFGYYYISPSVYPYGIIREEIDKEPFLVATKEKALCDTLYKIKNTGRNIDIEALLFDDLRIDETELLTLNRKDVALIAPLYGRLLILQLSEYLKKRGK